VTGHTEGKSRLSTSGISYVNRMVGTSVAPAFAFFLSGWRVDIIQAWVYFGLFVLFGLSNIALLARYNRELLNERGTTQADVHGADRVLAPLYLLSRTRSHRRWQESRSEDSARGASMRPRRARG